MCNGQGACRKFDGGIADPLPVKKAYELGAKKIIVIRTYEKEFRRKIKLENYIGAYFSKEYPELRKALLTHDKTYNNVSFDKFIRSEEKFRNLKYLKKQIQLDIKQAKK